MMSPGPPSAHNTIYPRSTPPPPPAPSSAMAQSPRAMYPAPPFPLYQLPPPSQPPPLHYTNTSSSGVAGQRYTGLALPPLYGSSGGGPSRHLVRPQHPDPLDLRRHHQRPRQSPPPLQQHHQPSTHPHHDRQTSTSYDRGLPAQQPAYASSPRPAYASHPPPYDHGYDPRFANSREQEERRRSSLGTMITPSPTFTLSGRRQSQQDETQYVQPQNPTAEERATTTNTSTTSPSITLEERSAPPSEPLPATSPAAQVRYKLCVRQQPVAARACGFGERDRRVIDPPPIVQLIITPPSKNALRYPFNVVHCTLYSVDGSTDETALTGVEKRLTRRLMGTLVASPFVGTDEEAEEGCFFCFPDLSCRTHGRYRLKFVLMNLHTEDLTPGGGAPFVADVMSDVFTVYTAKEFPGMRPSTGLTKALKKQGCAISVKKGNEKAVGDKRDGAGGGASGDQGEGGERAVDRKGKRRKKET